MERLANSPLFTGLPVRTVMADAEGDTKRSQLELSPQAAGEIRADFKRGFIRAETIAYEDYFSLGGESGAREAGKLRQEGKEYLVQDGDVMLFKFNV